MSLVEIPDDLLEAARSRGDPVSLLREQLGRPVPSERDALTGALGPARLRAHLEASLDGAEAGPWRERFLCLDLDDFQRFVEAQGQARGDAVLRQLVKDLHALYGREAVYRLGSDDLVVALKERSAWRPGTPPGAVLKYAEVTVALKRNRRRRSHLLGWVEHHLARGLLLARPEGAQVECRDPPGLPSPAGG